ncbi:Ff.00g056960.m01.CDS01 [Fusarium sp. VM40]|nr:Ff.00g056960.m01.CDS01 [Fusarium sp. VM40]
MTLQTSSKRLLNLNLGSLLLRKQHIPRRTNLLRISQLNTRLLSNSRPLKMSNDDDYMSFLNKANQDTGAGASTQEKTAFKAKDHGVEVPKAIAEVCKNAVYTSDADEPFEEVSLKWQGSNGLPSETEFAKLINHSSPDSADIDILDPLTWDSDGKYTDVIDAVREASQGNDVRVYQVSRDKTRTEYWVVSHFDGKLIGAKALSVES